MNAIIRLSLPFLILAILSACRSDSVQPASGGATSVANSDADEERVDFSGNWEMDYGRSDNLNEKLNSIYKDLQRQAARRSGSSTEYSTRGGVTTTSNPEVSNAIAGIIPLAKLADFITTSQALEIEQSDYDILVEREDTFALSCAFVDDSPEVVTDNLGSEVCGWDAHQLVFVVDLPEGTRINHRFTLAPDGQRLHIATRVSRGGNRNFTLNRVYYRFEPLPPDFECEYTLSRGNVCSRASS